MPDPIVAATLPGAQPTREAPDVAAAVAHLAQDGLVAFPTETVWGLAACARSSAAMNALRSWKGRDADQPVSLLIADAAVLAAEGLELSPLARRIIAAFWPGPLTLVIPARVIPAQAIPAQAIPADAALAAGVARDDGAVGVRCSSHPVAAALAGAAARAGLGPLTATSLNRSGQPPARDEAAARALCAGQRAPLVLDTGGDAVSAGPPTSVLDLTQDPPRILRVGAIDESTLRARVGVEVSSCDASTDPLAPACMKGEPTS
ncbi:MAG: L-threonylcarbamoyladenylate synthase [Deltaproteobacteria bacterium]|nr:L-threonylcarbamoyladenylate synthase [Deltaproteobacteria bacterium]